MADRPILFSAPMVRALLDGRKTQTRRVLKPQPSDICAGFQKVFTDPPHFEAIDANGKPCNAFAGKLTVHPYPPIRFAKGDRLWVREAWRMNHGGVISDAAGGQMDYVEPHIDYRADYGNPGLGWKPGIHMPRWASRLTLTVTDVRVQRLQEITPADAIAEGIAPRANSITIDCDTPNPRDDFQSLWASIKGAGSWDANPWIVAVSFTVERRNIDAGAER